MGTIRPAFPVGRELLFYSGPAIPVGTDTGHRARQKTLASKEQQTNMTHIKGIMKNLKFPIEQVMEAYMEQKLFTELCPLYLTRQAKKAPMKSGSGFVYFSLFTHKYSVNSDKQEHSVRRAGK